MAGRKKTRAAIVGGGNDRARAIRCGGGEHGARDFFGRPERNGADAGAGSAQECAECAGGFGRGDDLVEEWNEFFAVWLVQAVRERTLQALIFARGEGGGKGARIPGILQGVQTIDPGRQETTRFLGRDFELRNQKNEVKLRGNREGLPARSAHNVEAAISCRRGVVGVAFQFGTEFEEILALKRAA